MAHFLIYVFTGTGNTLRASHWLAEALRAEGESVSIVKIEDEAKPIIDRQADCLILAAATHGFTTPWRMLRFIRALPPGNQRKVYLITTRAGVKIGPFFPAGVAASNGYLMATLLRLKGYMPRGLVNLDMPSNWFSLHPIQHPTSIAQILARARQKVQVMSQVIHRRGSAWIRLDNLYELFTAFVLAPISLLYLLVGRFGLAKAFFTNSACTGCGTCVRACPCDALQSKAKNQKPYWTLHCESCMRCAAVCPHGAIEASHSWLALIIFLTLPSSALWLLQQLEGVFGFHLSLWVELPLYWCFVMASIVAGYHLLWLLSHTPVLRQLIYWSTLTRFWKRYREPTTKRRDLM